MKTMDTPDRYLQQTLTDLWSHVQKKQPVLFFVSQHLLSDAFDMIRELIGANELECHFLEYDYTESETHLPYAPLLEFCRTQLRDMPEQHRESILRKAVYAPQQQLFRDFLQSKPIERQEEILTDEIEYEKARMLQSVASLVLATQGRKPLLVKLSRLDQAGESSLRFLSHLFNWKRSSNLFILAGFEEPLLPADIRLQEIWGRFRENLSSRLRKRQTHPIIQSCFTPGAGTVHSGTKRKRKTSSHFRGSFTDLIEYSKTALAFLALDESRAQLEQVSNRLRESAPDITLDNQIALLRARGEVCILLGETDSALFHLTSFLNLAHQLHSKKLLAEAYQKTGRIHHLKQNSMAAKRFALQSLQLQDAIHDPVLEFRSNLLLFFNTTPWENPTLWNDTYAQLESAAIQLNMRNSLGKIIANSITYGMLGNRRKLELCQRAEDLAQELDNRHCLALVYNIRGMIYRHLGEFDHCLENMQHSMKLHRQLNEPLPAIAMLNSIGFVYLQQEHYDEACRYFLRAITRLKQLPYNEELLISLFNLGQTCLLARHYKRAARCFEFLIHLTRLLKLTSIPFHSVHALHSLHAIALIKEKDITAADFSLAQVDRNYGWQNPEDHFYYYIAQALVEAELQNHQAASSHCRQAEKILIQYQDDMVYRSLFPRLYYEFSLISLAGGETGQAERLRKQGLEWAARNRYPFHRELLSQVGRASTEHVPEMGLPRFRFSYASLLEKVRQHASVNQLHKRLNEINFLNGLQQTLAAGRSEQATFQDAMTLIHNSMPAAISALLLLREGVWECVTLVGAAKTFRETMPDIVHFFSDSTAPRLIRDKTILTRFSPALPPLSSMAGFPITSRGEVIGLLISGSLEQDPPLQEEDTNPLDLAARQLGAALERLTLERKVREKSTELEKAYAIIKEDLSLARNIQQKILPLPLQGVDGFHCAVRFQPMEEVGGDIYDISLFEDEIVRILLADATGHGVQGSLLTMLIKTIYEQFKLLIDNPGELLEILNMEIYNSYRSLNIFFSAVIVDIHLDRPHLHYASAGHPAQLLISNGSITTLPATGVVLGIWPEREYGNRRIPFGTEDKLLIFTDGVYEQFNAQGQELGDEWIEEQALRHGKKKVEDILEHIMTDVSAFLDGVPSNDDITLLGIERRQISA